MSWHTLHTHVDDMDGGVDILDRTRKRREAETAVKVALPRVDDVLKKATARAVQPAHTLLVTSSRLPCWARGAALGPPPQEQLCLSSLAV